MILFSLFNVRKGNGKKIYKYYDNDEAHSAAYDSDVTAKVFCSIVNKFDA